MGLSLASGAAMADALATPEANPAMAAKAPPTLPAKGITMAVVEKNFGAPTRKRATVGGDSPKHPPITRWDYDSFSVIFENDRVIDAVIPGAPPRVYNKDQLTPVAASAAPLPPALPAAAAPPEPEAEPIVPPPAESETIPEAPAAEAAAAEAPVAETAPETPAEAPPAEAPAPEAAPVTAYPDGPSAQTPAEEIPADAPPTPK